MPGPKPPQIVLSEEERVALENLVRAHRTGQALVRRARVVLLAAMGYSNMDIARLVPMDEEAVGLWRLCISMKTNARFDTAELT